MYYYTYVGPPFIVSLSDNTVVFEGDNVSFMCEVSNDPDAIEDVTFRWFYNNEHRLSNQDYRININNTVETHPSRTVVGTLTIDPVLLHDAGQYRCSALNHAEQIVYNTTQLIVRCKLTSSLTIHRSIAVLQIVLIHSEQVDVYHQKFRTCIS